MTPREVLRNFEDVERFVKRYRELQDHIDDMGIQLESTSLAYAENGEFDKAFQILEMLIRLGSQYAQGLSKDLKKFEGTRAI